MTVPMPAFDAAAAVPLVLLPGTLCDERLFQALVERLAPRPCVTLPLPPGTVDEAARVVLAAAPPRFALLGFSLGGAVALAVAAAAPRHVLGLALLGSNARAVPADAHAVRRAEARAGAGAPGRHVAETLWPSYVASANVGDAALRSLIAAMAEATGGALLEQTETALTRPDRRDALPALAMPALVLAGAKDAICPPDRQRELAAALPDAALALISGAGHFAPLERPDAVADHVAAWLDRVDRAYRERDMTTKEQP